MTYLDALQLLHEALRPDLYCEIGCKFGRSLALARTEAVGIDPSFSLKVQLVAPTRIFRMTSDAFFGRTDVQEMLKRPIDMSFIDGMHLVEFALRDFMNLEKFSAPGSVITIDDVLPQEMEHASRERVTNIWNGDVYRLVLVLRHFRPDLDIRVYDIEDKGFAVAANLDPMSTILPANYAGIRNELASGRWSCDSVPDIRDRLRPLPAAELTDHAAVLGRKRTLGVEPGRLREPAYLDLLKRSILNEIYLDDELRILYLRACLAGEDRFDPHALHDIRAARAAEYAKLREARAVGKFVDRKIAHCGFSHSMMGRARIDSLHACLDIIRREGIAGDLIECGVWRGGGCIFMAGYLRHFGMARRKVYVADSFQGLPPPTHSADAGIDLTRDKYPELAVTSAVVRENFAAYGLLGPNIVFLEGWFKDTLATAPIGQLALLRLDGDLYESTADALEALYDKVAPGGIVIVDDYHALAACRKAVADFFRNRGQEIPPLERIDWTGVWFRKA